MLQQNIANLIRQLRYRVQHHGDYLSSVDETRTRYTLIDPILRVLGWELSDPSQVKVEIDINVSTAVMKVDYALYNTGSGERPWTLVEAKRLDPRQIERFRNMQSLKQNELASSWEAFNAPTTQSDSRWSELNSQNFEEKTAIHEKSWSQLSRVNRVKQLSDYVSGFGMVEGYGVLTDGDEWSIYDIGRDRAFPQKPTNVVRVLGMDDSVAECAEALDLLRR